jgi:hypothetical protein
MFRPISPRPPRNAMRHPSKAGSASGAGVSAAGASGGSNSEETGVLQGSVDPLALLRGGGQERQAGVASR